MPDDDARPATRLGDAVSKERARTRAARQAELTARQDELARQRDAKAARLRDQRARQQRRQLLWRRARLWQHGPGFRRNKERWAALGTGVMSLGLVTYLVTRSWRDVLAVALICIIAGPVLVATIVQRGRP